MDVCRPSVRSGGSRVHSPSSSSRLAPAAGSLDRRATGTRPVHSPLFVMWPGVWAEVADDVKRPTASPVRARRSGAPAVADSADSADPSANARRGGRRCHARTARRAHGDTWRRDPRPHHPGRRTVPPREATPRSRAAAKRQRRCAPNAPDPPTDEREPDHRAQRLESDDDDQQDAGEGQDQARHDPFEVAGERGEHVRAREHDVLDLLPVVDARHVEVLTRLIRVVATTHDAAAVRSGTIPAGSATAKSRPRLRRATAEAPGADEEGVGSGGLSRRGRLSGRGGNGA